MQRITMSEEEQLAKFFHTLFDALAPVYEYPTREDPRLPWDELPANYRRLMVEVCKRVILCWFVKPEA